MNFDPLRPEGSTPRRGARIIQGSIFLILLITSILLIQCSPALEPTPTPTPALPTESPVPTRTPSPRPPTSTPTPLPPPSIFVPQVISGTLRATLLDAAQQNVLTPVKSAKNADVVISTRADGPNAQLLSERVFAVVDWYPSQRLDISSETLLDLWHGKPTSDGITTLLVTADTLGVLETVWGAPAENVNAVPGDALIDHLWTNHAALGIMPFDALIPKVKTLSVDGINVLDREAKLDSYALVTRLYASGDATFVNGLVAAYRRENPRANRDPQRMTKLIMTGVTAISRTSAIKIDAAGDPALPARKVADVLAAADLTHVSNEVPFTDSCKPVLGTLQLCSKPSYIESLKLAGVDLISSTGNHMNDYGIQAFLDTLDLFEQDGYKVYGGGRNDQEASRILYVEDHGNKLAFLGMNSFGPVSVWATDTRPGAQKYDPDVLKQELEEARKNADVVFYDMQADETYEYKPIANNIARFRDAIEKGADVVTGVQAHQPQAMEFSANGKKVILYGLGNLFFDQMQNDAVRQGLVVRHTIYNGRVIQTELLPTLLENYVQPRWATPEERGEILGLVFDASGFYKSKQ